MERPVSIPVSCSQPGNQTRASPGCSVTCRGWSVCEGSGGGRGEVRAAETPHEEGTHLGPVGLPRAEQLLLAGQWVEVPSLAACHLKHSH